MSTNKNILSITTVDKEVRENKKGKINNSNSNNNNNNNSNNNNSNNNSNNNNNYYYYKRFILFLALLFLIINSINISNTFNSDKNQTTQHSQLNTITDNAVVVNDNMTMTDNDSIIKNERFFFNLCPVSSLVTQDSIMNGNKLLSYPHNIYYLDNYNNTIYNKSVTQYQCYINNHDHNEHRADREMWKNAIGYPNDGTLAKYDSNDPKYYCTEFLTCPLNEKNIIAATSGMNSDTTTTTTNNNNNNNNNNDNAYDNLCSTLSAWNNETLIGKRFFSIGGSIPAGAKAFGCCCDPNIDKKCDNNNNNNINNNNNNNNSKENKCHEILNGVYGLNSNQCRWGDRLNNYIQMKYQNVKYHNMARGGVSSQFFADQLIPAHNKENNDLYSSNDLLFLDFSINDQRQNDTTGIESLIRRIYEKSDLQKPPTIIVLEFFSKMPIYREICKHYSLPLWSFLDVISHSEFTHFNVANTLDHHSYHDGYHPPWHVHLFLADLYAALLEKETFNCKMNINNKNEKKPFKLPEPLYHTDKKMCHSRNTILDITALEVYKDTHSNNNNNNKNNKNNNNNNDFISIDNDEYNFTSSSSWKVLQDGVDKFGWIIDEDSAINPSYFSKKNTLSFHIVDSNWNDYKMVKMNIKYFITITFLRTYLNAGKAGIYINNHLKENLDALWDNKISVPVSISFTYYHKKMDGNSFSIDIRYLYDNKLDINESKKRDKQKVKIESIKVCSQSI